MEQGVKCMAATDSSEVSGDNSGAASHQTSGGASDADSDAHSNGITEAQAYQAKLGRSLCTGCFGIFVGNALVPCVMLLCMNSHAKPGL